MKVPKRLIKPHPAILAARQHYRPPYHQHDVTLWLPRHATEAAALDVSKGQFHRGLCILNALLKACAKHGWPTSTEWQIRTYVNTVTVEAHPLTFRLRERCRQVVRKLTDGDRDDLKRGRSVYHAKVLQPTGLLNLTIKPAAGSGPHGWEDSPDVPMEDQLDEFFPALQRTAAALAARRGRLAREQAQRDHEQALTDALKQHQEAWKFRADQLWTEVGTWHQAERGRGYLQAARRQLLANGPPTSAQDAWLAWATQVITAADPLTAIAERDVRPWDDDHPINMLLQQRALSGEVEGAIRWPFVREDVERYVEMTGPGAVNEDDCA